MTALVGPEGARMYDLVFLLESFPEAEFVRLSGGGLYLLQIPLTAPGVPSPDGTIGEVTQGEVGPTMTYGKDALLALRRSRAMLKALVHFLGGKPKVVLGRKRAVCDVELAFEGVSRQHAEAARSPAGWTVMDLGSRNGTFLDGEQLPPSVPAPLAPDSVLQIGQYRAVVEDPAALYQLTTRLRGAQPE